MKRDSITNTFIVATVLCIACSVMVSGAAVILRPWQLDNKQAFQQKNILIAAGLIESGERVSDATVGERFEAIETAIIDFETGMVTDDVDLATFDQRAAAKDPNQSVETEGLGGFRRREKYGLVYLFKEAGEIKQIVLPVYGKGLWSTLYGYLAIERDKNTIAGLTFYEHKETPGLGGEIDNPQWQAQWVGKQIADEAGEIKIEVIKGKVIPDSPNAVHQVDGLSGATITSRGVSNLIRYWLSEEAYGKYLAQL